jgi:hypothetical protein
MSKVEELVKLLEADDKAGERHVLKEHLKVLGKRRRFVEEAENETQAKIQKLGPEEKSPFGAYRDDPTDPNNVQPEHDDQKQATSKELVEEARTLQHRALWQAEAGQYFYLPEDKGDHVKMVPFKLLEAPGSTNTYHLTRKDEVKLKTLVFSEDDYVKDSDLDRYVLPVELPVADTRKVYKYLFPNTVLVYVD